MVTVLKYADEDIPCMALGSPPFPLVSITLLEISGSGTPWQVGSIPGLHMDVSGGCERWPPAGCVMAHCRAAGFLQLGKPGSLYSGMHNRVQTSCHDVNVSQSMWHWDHMGSRHTQKKWPLKHKAPVLRS